MSFNARTYDVHWGHGGVVEVCEGDQLGNREREDVYPASNVREKFPIKAVLRFIALGNAKRYGFAC